MMKMALQWEYQPFLEGILNDYRALFKEYTLIKKGLICIDHILFHCIVLSRENTIIKKGFRVVDIILYISKMRLRV